METVYAALNRAAKSWPPYQGQRDRQRETIRRDVKVLRQALATQGAHVSIGWTGEGCFYYSRNAHISGMASNSGTIAAARRLGIPIVDLRGAEDFSDLASVTISGPMCAVGHAPDRLPAEGGYRSLDYAPFDHWLGLRRALAGVVIENDPGA